MAQDELDIVEKKRFYISLFYAFIFVLVCWMTKIYESIFGVSLVQYGIFPRNIHALTGILTAPFIHADYGHLGGNSVSLIILITTLFYFYRDLSFSVILYIFFIGNSLLWIGGREAWHIGASELTYGIAFFLFLSGIIRKNVALMSISLFVVFMYGSMVWHLFPFQIDDPISWEGHLFGAITGMGLAIVFRKKGPQQPLQLIDEGDGVDDEEYAEEEISEDELSKNRLTDNDTNHG